MNQRIFLGKEEHLMEITLVMQDYVILRSVELVSDLDNRTQIVLTNKFDIEWIKLNCLFFITENIRLSFEHQIVDRNWLSKFWSNYYNVICPISISTNQSVWSQFYKYSIALETLPYSSIAEINTIEELYKMKYITSNVNIISRTIKSFLLTGDINIIYWYFCIQNVLNRS